MVNGLVIHLVQDELKIKLSYKVVYSNTGEVWDGQARIWRGEGGQWFKHIKEWVSFSYQCMHSCS